MDCPLTVGMRVVCVDDVFVPPELVAYLRSLGVTFPRQNHTYMVRWLGEWETNNVCVRVAELVNAEYTWVPSGNVSEPAFHARRFRPLVARRTSIEVFQTIRRGLRALEDA